MFKKFLCPYILSPYIFTQVQVLYVLLFNFLSFIVFIVCYDDFAKIIQRPLMLKKILCPYILCPYIFPQEGARMWPGWVGVGKRLLGIF